ncbi:c-type cytochrome [Rhodospirillaceae bacterium SYSU D60014]|uniref:c-type cytochrome n=1 Tax=Virgifigura deserti TaxID=2268457 RepID=UPI000E66AD92
MRSIASVVLSLGFVLSCALPAGAEDGVKRGEYLTRIMDCVGCHTSGALIGKPNPALHLAGSDIGFEVPGLGIFYPPNLTPDSETGLGEWSEEDIVTAIRAGVRPDGRELAPAMPWRSYAALTDADAQALATYLKSLPPTRSTILPPIGPGEKAPAPYFTVVMPK